jgi:hypothetical protein
LSGHGDRSNNRGSLRWSWLLCIQETKQVVLSALSWWRSGRWNICPLERSLLLADQPLLSLTMIAGKRCGAAVILLSVSTQKSRQQSICSLIAADDLWLLQHCRWRRRSNWPGLRSVMLQQIQ